MNEIVWILQLPSTMLDSSATSFFNGAKLIPKRRTYSDGERRTRSLLEEDSTKGIAGSSCRIATRSPNNDELLEMQRIAYLKQKQKKDKKKGASPSTSAFPILPPFLG